MVWILRYRLVRLFFSTSLHFYGEGRLNTISIKNLLKKVLFLECIKLNGMGFDKKLLNATLELFVSNKLYISFGQSLL